ncbi:hypothetical protein SAY87_030056 [Trapa incisa]|uniref:BHLH domain-containing protein n=1 Tax=Trapa incisa TaxID=236973 RepID=A0AAN7KE83_9MYRT|nr:hypothetical protein SAY87_030056 [Trapa incisa]
MEPLPLIGDSSHDPPYEHLLFNEEIQRLIFLSSTPAWNDSCSTAILDVGSVELVHWPQLSESSKPYLNSVDDGVVLFASMSSANTGYGTKCVAYASGENGSSPDTSSVCPSKAKKEAVPYSASEWSSWTHPAVSDTAPEGKVPSSTKRNEREQQDKPSVNEKRKKKKKNERSQDAESLPYVHVRARPGQATDSHCLAERARREKINARMKLLRELVPGCNEITGTALVLDEIINHVHSLQSQVELLSMKLAAVNPHIDFNLDSIFAPENVSLLDSNFPLSMTWLKIQINGIREIYQQGGYFPTYQHSTWVKEEGSSFAMGDASYLTSTGSANAVPLDALQGKMEM